jgi:hypothetical protein
MTALVKQITVVILALIGFADAQWGLGLLGHLSDEAVSVLVTLALAVLGFTGTTPSRHPSDGDAQP